MLRHRNLAVLGAGKIGEALIRGLLESELLERENIIATAKHQKRLDYLAEHYGVRTTLDNALAVEQADLVLLSVKPQTMCELLEEIAPAVAPRHLLISVAASVPTAFIESLLPIEVPVVRAMPNTPCVIRAGMTVLCRGRHATESHLQLARSLFDAVGRTMILDESQMDAVTGLSASGPAFIYVIIESLAEAGVKVGLAREVATELAAQTTLGAAKMVLVTNEHPAKLKDAVTTPAGCTIDGLLELEEGGLRVTLIKAVVKATERARCLFSNGGRT
ncbi:MAG: pyrroline-5-carboxylate reductase [Blastocatellia bacterium]|nr:pyrroline-5-carboxylate reductase [Blastocatellia bacterium]MCS7158490.1 pyrroline-5-carboxylate reductase [Blastocatellia bacterium]MCX7753439.1 pyrroline-5-carboxylate reductase [Blastocatellia bacterium]MDW8167829.1 pyrroline-5-carboxylate reductase [Acidobacteriota bacterium]